MLKETEVIKITGLITEKLKSGNKSMHSHQSSIDWGNGYKQACKHASEIKVHAEMGDFPEELMTAKAPNETPEELAYRKAIFESITVPYWHKAENAINRIWAEQNFVIDYGSDKAKVYYTQEFPVYDSLIKYFQSVVTKKKIRDPNAVMCLAFDVPMKEGDNGELIPDQSEELQPYGKIYESCDVCLFELGDFALLMSEEKSVIKVGGKDLKEGAVFYLYDTKKIYRIYQVGAKQDYKFDWAVYYEHNVGTLPAWKLRGVPCEVVADNPIYQSYFVGALPYLNKALKNDSTLDLIIYKHAYPVRAYFESPCSNKDCNNGMVYTAGKDPEKCGTCKGAGKLHFSPARDFIQQPPGALDSAEQIPFPGFTYVSPPAEILEFNRSKIKEDIVSGFAFINIDITNDVNANGTEQTATAVRINRDEFYSFLLNISSELFGLMDNFMKAANKVKWGQEVKPIVSPPKNFDLITPAELTQELATVGLPSIAIGELTADYLVKRFTQKSTASKIYELIRLTDGYSGRNTTEIISLKSQGVAQLWEVILHEKILNYIYNEIAVNPQFLDNKPEANKAVLQEKAKTEAALIGVKNTADDLLKGLGTGGAA